MNIDSIIIIGGGSSINKGIFLGLKERIKNKCVLLCNYAYRYFDGTALVFTDALNNENDFYYVNYNDIIKFPLSFGCDRNLGIKKDCKNIIWLNHSDNWIGIDKFKEGVYSGVLAGYFAISTAMFLLNKIGNIYLLGFDWTKRTKKEKLEGISAYPYLKNNKEKVITHFYNDAHRGQGYTSYYETTNPNTMFEPFLNEKKIHIYNVSPQSNIQIFPKINYLEFFKRINKTQNYNNINLNIYIRSKF